MAGGSRLSADAWQKARILWESDAAMTLTELAEIVAVSKQAIQQRAKREGWKKVSDQGELARRAYDKADEAALTNKEPAIPPAGSPMQEVVADTAVALRAKVLERHRKEWDGARNNVYKAIQTNDFEKAKLGKITAEAIKIIQDGERKAWGFDKDEGQQGKGDGKVTVVIERKEV